MRRGEIYYADLSPTVGSEINQRRPVLIVSNDANNRAANTVTVLPITSSISRVYPFRTPRSPGAEKPRHGAKNPPKSGRRVRRIVIFGLVCAALVPLSLLSPSRAWEQA